MGRASRIVDIFLIEPIVTARALNPVGERFPVPTNPVSPEGTTTRNYLDCPEGQAR